LDNIPVGFVLGIALGAGIGILWLRLRTGKHGPGEDDGPTGGRGP
jgi:hypothetical protein